MLNLFISNIPPGYNSHAGYRIKFKLICRLTKYRDQSSIDLDIHNTRVPSSAMSTGTFKENLRKEFVKSFSHTSFPPYLQTCCKHQPISAQLSDVNKTIKSYWPHFKYM